MTAMRMEPFVAEREWTVEGIPVVSARVTLPKPVPLEGKTAKRIWRYYQLQCRSYLRYCEKWLAPQARAEYDRALTASTTLPHFRAELAYRVTWQDERFLSLCTQSREDCGGSTALTRRGDTWDLLQSCPVSLQSFFPPRSPWKRRVLSWLTEEVRRQIRAGAAQYHEDWRKALRRRFNPQNYCLTGEGLALFYPMYALAPASGGIPTFVIPYKELGEGWEAVSTAPPPAADSPGD